MASGQHLQAKGRSKPTPTSATGMFQPRPFAEPAIPKSATTSELQTKVELGENSDRLSRIEISPASTHQPKFAIATPGAIGLTLQRQKATEAGEASPDLESSISQAKSGGMPLGEPIRRQMEGAFGANFSGVKVHTDNTADTLNRSLSARAFTTGNNIFFKRGEYNPGSSSGKELLAHELTHTLQQGAVQRQTSFPQPAPVNTLQNKSEVEFPEWKPAKSFGNSQGEQQNLQTKLSVGAPNDKYEQEADRVARDVVQRINAPIPDPPPSDETVCTESAEQVQRTLAPDEEAEFKKILDLEKKEAEVQLKRDDTLQRSPDPSLQLAPQHSTPSLGNLIQRQGKSTLTPDKGDGEDITVVTRKGTWLGGAKLTDKEKTDLKAYVKTAREYGAAAVRSITRLETEFSTTSWAEIDDDIKDNFVGNFSGYEEDPEKLRSLINQAKQAMTRTNTGLSQPLKIVEKHKAVAPTLKGYVKFPVADDKGGLKSVPSSKMTQADADAQIELPFLDERTRPGSIHLQFGKFLTKKKDAPHVIYHEATHKFASTDDEAGYDNRLAVLGQPPEKTIKNADCYAWYAANAE
ncbi:DUF4157 domain-containing protein [Oscillatoria sp. HE19RPO]|uniref:eCIS core domain-containing protein n=1 Tax=Oscillatoria sp. HE19RPO TaxID=2954806 RepID=UPI0020C4E721|nr:DUF4157 domain-containing protein [Oscillatoria sp. HE19RPO]